MKVLYNKDANPALIRERRVAVLGFGAQGRAHALKLRDSGVDVVVGLQPSSPSRAACAELGLATAAIEAAVRAAGLVMVLIPDQVQAAVYAEAIAPHLSPGAAVAFAHGFSVHYRRIRPSPDVDVVLVAPLGIGDQVRATFAAGGGVPALLAVHQDASGLAHAVALSYAWANGHGRAGVIETTFRDETETDLFAEQAVLCGGLTHLVQAGFDTLTEAGYPPELAYFGCLHEVKLIADLMYARGIAGMRQSISATAEYGDYTRGPRVINAESRNQMRQLLGEIQSGAFAEELQQEVDAGAPTLSAGRDRAARHAIEQVGSRLRAMMPWLAPDGSGD